ncbi:hypothetical protein ACP4OV_010123 [Aristida adscensionis]
MVACTQPHQEVALDVAVRVSHEMGVNLGHECVIMIDEVYERTLSTDMLLALMKDIICFWPHLKLLISSADLDAEKFSGYFNSAPILKIPGKQYPVQIHYTKAPVADFIGAAIATVLKIHVTQPPRDILVFLTGTEEIETFDEILKYRTRGLVKKMSELITCPIYTNLPTEFQAKIFEPEPTREGARKVILVTYIAETSLTIDGIKYVIDPGFCKLKSYNPQTGQESLVTYTISKVSANQRARIFGLSGPGKCFRLFPSHCFHDLEDNTVPEIQQTSLVNVVLTLKCLGIHDLVNFDCLDPPPSETLMKALEQLYALSAMNCCGQLTKTGRTMAQFPLNPMLSKMIVASDKYKCSYEIYNSWKETDYSTQWCYDNYIQVDSMKRARDIRDQLEGLLKRVEIEICSNANDLDGIKKAITSGFFYHSRLQNNGYVTAKKLRTVYIHPSSGLALVRPQFVIFYEIVETTKEYMRQVTEINPEWLVEIAPHYYQLKDLDGCPTGYQRTHESLRLESL